LRAGDIIVALDDEVVADGRDALNRIAARAPGTRVRMRVWRNDEMIELEAEIGERSSP
jgi:S1-C subfamily serine protease